VGYPATYHVSISSYPTRDRYRTEGG